jgi:hypothetical protein
MIIGRRILFELEMFQRKIVAIIKAYILCLLMYFPKIEYLKKNGRATWPADDSMTHARCMLDTLGYKHTLRICNTIAFPRQQ